MLLSAAAESSHLHLELKPCCSSFMMMFQLVKMRNEDHRSRNGTIDRPCTHSEAVCSLLLILVHSDWQYMIDGCLKPFKHIKWEKSVWKLKKKIKLQIKLLV